MINEEVEQRRREATEMVQSLPADATKDVATAALQSLPPGTTQERKDIATAALQSLPTNTAEAVQVRKDVATTAVQGLSAKDQAEVAGQLQGPTQQVTNRIWQIIVWAFSIVFVLGTGALIVGVFINPQQLQILVTVFTTVAGILAGFISGRASSSESPSNPSG
jgi:hypothetical protein